MIAQATAAATAAAESSASGLPQFDLAQWPGEVAWALAIFAGLYLLFAYVFVPRVSGAIETREDTISGDIGDAMRLRNEAQAKAEAADADLDVARNRAHRLAADARAQVKADAAARQAEEDAKLAERLGAADQRIAAARAEAMGHVRTIAAETAHAMVERLTGAAPSAAELESALGAEA